MHHYKNEFRNLKWLCTFDKIVKITKYILSQRQVYILSPELCSLTWLELSKDRASQEKEIHVNINWVRKRKDNSKLYFRKRRQWQMSFVNDYLLASKFHMYIQSEILLLESPVNTKLSLLQSSPYYFSLMDPVEY